MIRHSGEIFLARKCSATVYSIVVVLSLALGSPIPRCNRSACPSLSLFPWKCRSTVQFITVDQGANQVEGAFSFRCAWAAAGSRPYAGCRVEGASLTYPDQRQEQEASSSAGRKPSRSWASAPALDLSLSRATTASGISSRAQLRDVGDRLAAIRKRSGRRSINGKATVVGVAADFAASKPRAN
jgi:hypothetical protein